MIQPGKETNLPTSADVMASGNRALFAFNGFSITVGMVILAVVIFLLYQTFFAKRRRRR